MIRDIANEAVTLAAIALFIATLALWAIILGA